MFKGIDELAERIRALGHPAPASVEQFKTLSGIREETAAPSGADMVMQLVSDHETIARRLREAKMIADKAEDEVTLGLLTDGSNSMRRRRGCRARCSNGPSKLE